MGGSVSKHVATFAVRTALEVVHALLYGHHESFGSWGPFRSERRSLLFKLFPVRFLRRATAMAHCLEEQAG